MKRAAGAGYIYVYVNVSVDRPAVPRTVPPAKTFSITELSQEFEVTPRAIRFYEDKGLLEPERRGQTRVYHQRDRTRLKLTLRGKRLGLSLAEVKRLVDMYESPSDSRPQLEAFLAMLGAHRSALERQLADLQLTLAEIGQHEARCRRMLAGLDDPAVPRRRRATAKAAA